MKAGELFSTINTYLKTIVEVHDRIFRFRIRHLFSAIEFQPSIVLLERTTVSIDKLESKLQLDADHWNLELGEQGATLVLAYLASLKNAAVKLGNISQRLACKADGQPYSYRQYKTDVGDYRRLESAYSALGVGMNNLARSSRCR